MNPSRQRAEPRTATASGRRRIARPVALRTLRTTTSGSASCTRPTGDDGTATPTSSQIHLVRRLMQESTPPFGTKRVLMDTLVDGVRCRLVREESTPLPPTTPIILSPRECEIARMICRGLPNKRIAQALEISVWTVGTYLRRMFSKLGVTSRAALVAVVLENSVLDQEPGEPTPSAMCALEIANEAARQRSRTTSCARLAGGDGPRTTPARRRKGRGPVQPG